MGTFTIEDAGDDILDVRDIIERIEELRAQQSPCYVAGWNMPGYMPNCEPAEFDNAEDAKEYIADEMDRQADEHENPEGEEAEDWRQDATKLRQAADEEIGVTIGNYHYFISQDGTMGLDEDERNELAKLEAFMASIKGYGGDEQWEGDWYPVTLIHESHFNDYMDEMLEDCGDIPKDLPCYLRIVVDYDALKMDYTSEELEGHTYLMR